MDRRDAKLIAHEFRDLRKQVDDLDRRLATTILNGKAAEVDGDRVRLELAPADTRTGKKFLSPWVQLQEAAGQTGTHFPVKVGDPLRLLSPNGEIGPQSLAIRDGYTDDKANPTDKKQNELAIAHDGPIVFRGTEIVFDGVVYLGGKGGQPVHRVGDFDDGGDKAVDGATRVFAV